MRSPAVHVAVAGFAANLEGSGVAYARATVRGQTQVLRLPFQVRPEPGLLERQIGYAAVTAVAKKLAENQIGQWILRVDDTSLIGDLQGHREVPAALCLSYVRLGCALNALGAYLIETGSAEAADLTARARAEVHLAFAA